jgi:hypothetical protein
MVSEIDQHNIDQHNNGFDPEEEAAENAFKGARVNLSELKRGDGILTVASSNYQSLLHRVISAIGKNEDYRNELKVALWSNSDEADDAVAAINECNELGMDPTPIIDQIIARSSGKNHELLSRALEALTHTTFTTNYQNQNRRRNNANKTSPLS